MSLTAAQILDLAPDASSRKAGQDQAKPAKWSALARQGDLIWGEIKGSGADPYRTVADLSGPASKCSCPSRKFPCKHALGLMLVEAAAPDALKEGEQPDWVSAWSKNRASRAANAETKADAPPKPVDEKAQAKRRQAREEKVSAALDELELWLRDLMRRGLASARSEPYAFWDRMAGRLVDGQGGTGPARPGASRARRSATEGPARMAWRRARPRRRARRRTIRDVRGRARVASTFRRKAKVHRHEAAGSVQTSGQTA